MRRIEPIERGVLLAVVVGFVLRIAWVTWATTSAGGLGTDGTNFLRMAGDLSNGVLPRFGTRPTDFYPVGYPAALVPLAWFTAKTDWLSLAYAAALFNAVAGTASVFLTARLAAAWVGPAAATPAAWLMAVGGGQLFFTSSPVSETLYIAVSLLGLVLLTHAVDATWSTRGFVAIGVVAGYAVLVRTPGLVLFVAPALIIRARSGAFRGALRPTLLVVAGAAVLLVPWTVRNGVQVGAWIPTTTNNAAVMCAGHRDGADGVHTETPDLLRDCYVGSPYDNAELYPPGEAPALLSPEPQDEGVWYRSHVADAVRYATTHPIDEIRLTWWKTYEALSGEPDALRAARQFTEDTWPSPFAASVLTRFADAWQGVVLVLAALGVAFVPACRRAVPIWGLALAYLIAIWGGTAQAHYKLPAVPLLAILAGAAITAVRAERPAS